MKNVCKIHCPNCKQIMIYEPKVVDREVVTLEGIKLWSFPARLRCPKCRYSTSKLSNNLNFEEIKCPRCKGHGKITVGTIPNTTKR